MNSNHLKPYAFVHVTMRGQNTESGRYTFIGEVMSYPLPTGTIMVRRVPGHPGTLEEVAVADLAPVEKIRTPRFVNYAAVKGFGQFPTDMLRYDSCAPVNFRLVEDRHGTPFSKPELLPGHEGEELMVARTSTTSRNVNWTEGRWASFMWKLTRHTTEPLNGRS